MIKEHLSDLEIQQYAEDRASSARLIIEHIAGCDHCRQKIDSYKELFRALNRQPVPSFDFNLSAEVVARIEQAKQRNRWVNLPLYTAAFIGIGLLGFSFYWYRKYLLKIFTGVFTYFLYLLIITAATILIFQCIDFYRSYQKKLKALGL